MTRPVPDIVEPKVREQHQFQVQYLCELYSWDTIWTDPMGDRKHIQYSLLLEDEAVEQVLWVHRETAHNRLKRWVNLHNQDQWMATECYSKAGWVV